jgi:hypothetical protein
VFFLLAALLSSNFISVNDTEGGSSIVQITTENSDDQLETLGEVLDKLPLDEQKQAEIEKIIAESEDEAVIIDTNEFSFNDKPWDRETNPVDIGWLPDWLNERINDEIENSPQKAKLIDENPNLIVDKVFDILPATMFVLLPVVALIFKFWYLFAKRYYIEHLIFSLHNHSFIFVSLVVILLSGLGGDLLGAQGYTTAVTATEWLNIGIYTWIPIYLLISLRVVYQQGWWLTMGKFFVIGISYITLLILVTSGVAIASFVLL